MAQEDFNDFAKRVEHAESRGRRYGKDGKLLTSPKGAQGEMQVMPTTQTDPGFGVTPAKPGDDADIARVGRDYLAAMEKRYGGNREYAAVAYNWGPGNADKWIAKGADFSKLPAETQAYVQSVTGGVSAPSATAQASPKEVTPKEVTPKTTPAADMGTGYQAALALSFLNDQEDDDEKAAAKLEEEQDSEAAKMLAEHKPFNALASLDLTSTAQPQAFKDGGDVETPMLFSVPTYAETVSHEMYPGQGGQFDQKDAARHMLAAGTLARKYGENAAEMLGNLHEIKTSPLRWVGSKLGISQMPVDYEQDLHNNRVGIELAKRSKSQKDLEDLINMEAERARTQQTPGTAWIGKPVRRADGSPEEGEVGAYFGNPNIQRQGAAARQLAAMRDVNTLPDPRTYAAVSGFLGTPPTEQGFSVMHPDAEAIRKAGEAGFGLGTAAAVAPVMGPAAKMLGKMAGSALNDRLLAGQSLTPGFNTPAPISFISRPAGGEFPTSGSALATQHKSVLDKHLAELTDDVVSNIDRNVLSKEQGEAGITFLDDRLRKYYRSHAGSVSDPVREAIISGKIKFAKDSPEEEMFPQALIDAARKGDVTAMKTIETTLDESMNVRSHRIIPEDEPWSGRRQANEEFKQNMLSQMSANPTIIPDSMLLRLTTKNADTLSPQEAAARVADIRAKMAENPGYFSTVLEPKMSRLLTSDLESISESSIRQYADLYPALTTVLNEPAPKGIASLGTTERPIVDLARRTNPLGIRNSEIIDTIGAMTADELKKTSVPDFFARVIKEKARNVEVDRLVPSAERLASANKPIPEKTAFYGTKPFIEKDSQGMQWREITDPAATILHSAMLDNSIKGYSRAGTYGALGKGRSSLVNGDVRLFGLYNNKNQLVTNVEYVTGKTNDYRANTITQFYGDGPRTGNVIPMGHPAQVYDLIEKLQPDRVPHSIADLLKDNGYLFTPR